jgi:hypothetical protein
MLKHRYLLGIFAANLIYEIVVTIFDFNFKLPRAQSIQALRSATTSAYTVRVSTSYHLPACSWVSATSPASSESAQPLPQCL